MRGRPWSKDEENQLQQHDDVFWSIALAVYATVELSPEPFIAVIPR